VSDRGWTRTEPRWTPAELVELLRADARNGIAPPITRWRKAADRPSASSVVRLWGSWSRLVEAAGLQTSRQAAAPARPARREARPRASRPTPKAPPKAKQPQTEGPLTRRRREEREAAHAEFDAQIAEGMVVRKLTEDDRARLERARRRRLSSPEPPR
jgi:hypothetical protein